jgi:phage gp29-like protein
MILGKYHSGATADDRAKLQTALRALGSDAVGIMPADAEIDIREVAKTGSVMAFDKLWSRLDEAVVKTVLGQTKTSMGDGGSLALAEVHNEVRSDITQADIHALTETLNEQLIQRLTIWNFGPAAASLAPVLGFVYVNEKKRQARLADIDRGHALGLDLGEAFVRRELNLPEPEEGETVIPGKRQQPTIEGTLAASQFDIRNSQFRSGQEAGQARPFRGAIRGKPWIK